MVVVVSWRDVCAFPFIHFLLLLSSWASKRLGAEQLGGCGPKSSRTALGPRLGGLAHVPSGLCTCLPTLPHAHPRHRTHTHTRATQGPQQPCGAWVGWWPFPLVRRRPTPQEEASHLMHMHLPSPELHLSPAGHSQPPPLWLLRSVCVCVRCAAPPCHVRGWRWPCPPTHPPTPSHKRSPIRNERHPHPPTHPPHPQRRWRHSSKSLWRQ